MTEKSIGRQMSGCETLIMKIVWSAKEDISTQEISSRLKSQYNNEPSINIGIAYEGWFL